MILKKWWEKYRLTSEGNDTKIAQNDKTIINTIYMKLDFRIIKKIVRKYLDKTLKSLKSMLHSQVNKWSEITSLMSFYVKYEILICLAVLT